jgi:conjugal transfer pilus assembly protein TraU
MERDGGAEDATREKVRNKTDALRLVLRTLTNETAVFFLIYVAFSTFSGRAAETRPAKAALLTRFPMCAGNAFSRCLSGCLCGGRRRPGHGESGQPYSNVPHAATDFLPYWDGDRLLGADGPDGCQPLSGCMVNMGGFSLNLGKTGMGTAKKDDKQVNGAFYHVHWYKYPLTSWLSIITSAGACRAEIWISPTSLKLTRPGWTAA